MLSDSGIAVLIALQDFSNSIKETKEMIHVSWLP